VTHGGSDSAAGVREGDILAGKYRVERVLGVGGMGVVVAAHHLQLDEKVALKFLLPEALGNPEAVARFAREARAAVKIKSEHVARVSDVGTLPNGAPYMVMEYLEGGDLAAWLKQRGPLPVDQAVEFVLQACIAVADAHALGIIHRDLKPANLFCVRRSDGQLSIKVLDFGISKMNDTSRSGSPWVTRTSALMGSPLYMSPEQMLSSKDVDAQTDIWALGVILFELMTGRLAFFADSIMELAIKVAHEKAPSIRSFRPDVPAALESVVEKCMQKDPQDRYRNVAELALALLPFAPARAKASVERISGIIQAAGLSASALAVRPSPPSPDAQASAGTIQPLGRTTVESPGRKWAALVGGVGTGLILVALVGVALWKRESTRRDDSQMVQPSGPPAAQAPAFDPPPVAPTPMPPVAAPVAAPVAPPETAATTTTKKKPPVASAPCKLVKTLDKSGEWHFSCPCATCQ
jgi:serine/threonine-protein kinase